MAIRYRPYAVPDRVLRVHRRLNQLYDEGIDTYLGWIGERPWPRAALKISVTNKCNLSCTYCYDKESQPPREEPVDMEPTVVRRIFQRYPDPSYVFVLGGEPFLNPRAVETILEECPSRVAVSTNGQVSNQEVDLILKKIVQRNQLGRTALLQVSCELGGRTMARHSPDDRWSEATLAHFADVCGRYLKIKYTLTQPDVARIGSIAQWYWDRGLLVQFDYADGGFGAGVALDLPDEDAKTVFDFARRSLQHSLAHWGPDATGLWHMLRAKTLFNPIIPVVLMQLKRRQPIWSACGILGHSVYIGPQGQLYPCHRFKRAQENRYGWLGVETQSGMAMFHRRMGPLVRGCCRGCLWRGTCGGVCPAVICGYGSEMLGGRCRFMGALRDAFWLFITDGRTLSHPQIGEYVDALVRFSPFHRLTYVS